MKFKRRRFNVILAFWMSLFIFFHPDIEGYANTLTPSCDSLKDCDALIGDLNDQMSEIEEVEKEKEDEKQDLQAQRFALRDEVSKIQANIITLKSEISSLQDEIKLNELKRDELATEIELLHEKVNHIVVLNHKLQRKNIFLTVLSESESLVDLIRNFRNQQRYAKQAQSNIQSLSELVRQQNDILEKLEADKANLVTAKTALESDEAALVEKMESLIAIEQQIQKELQRLQTMKMEANEIKEIIEEQKKAILEASNETFGIPLEKGYVSCEFACYVDTNGVPHNGIDLGNYGDTSTRILASASGIVTRAGWHVAYGNHVMITHNINGTIFTTVYAHMSQAPSVSVGQSVEKGQFIGYMGNTGNSSGAHLHFELYRGYYNWPNSINPREYISFPSKW